MNHGVIEQFGPPQDIYDKPASMFVAEFIGSPSMNFLRFEGRVARGATCVELKDQPLGVPTLHENFDGPMAYGVAARAYTSRRPVWSSR